MRVLILGGTGEAAELAALLGGDPRFHATLSLAGRTARPKPATIAMRIGGFGGAAGLARWLAAARIEAVVDATHPFASNISRNALVACTALGVPLATLARSPWREQEGDRWIHVADAAAAVEALGAAPQRVFLSLGRLELGRFAAAPQHHYTVRSIDPPQDVALPPRIRFIFARGPFEEAAEHALLAAERISVLVSKNSGGSATYPKIAAARALALPVVMIARPPKAGGTPFADARRAAAWLEALGAGHGSAPQRRGV
jgi:precorrin-6A/cobalt-precorrin-6A reductase